MASHHQPQARSDELSAIATRILARESLDADAAMAGVPVSGTKFNTLLADAKRLAEFVLQRPPYVDVSLCMACGAKVTPEDLQLRVMESRGGPDDRRQGFDSFSLPPSPAAEATHG